MPLLKSTTVITGLASAIVILAGCDREEPASASAATSQIAVSTRDSVSDSLTSLETRLASIDVDQVSEAELRALTSSVDDARTEISRDLRLARISWSADALSAIWEAKDPAGDLDACVDNLEFLVQIAPDGAPFQIVTRLEEVLAETQQAALDSRAAAVVRLAASATEAGSDEVVFAAWDDLTAWRAEGANSGRPAATDAEVSQLSIDLGREVLKRSADAAARDFADQVGWAKAAAAADAPLGNVMLSSLLNEVEQQRADLFLFGIRLAQEEGIDVETARDGVYQALSAPHGC